MNKKLLSILLLIIALITTITNINFTKTNNNYKNNLSSERHNKVRPETFMSLKSTDQTKVYLDKTFSDPNLIANLKIELKTIIKQDDQGCFIYQNDVEQVTSLNLIGDKIINPEGLGIFINLSDLILTNNYNIKNLIYLSTLVNLKTLKLERCNIGDLSFIKSLTNLINLDLNHATIKDISALSYLVNLQKLDLNTTIIKNLNPIANLKNLMDLNLESTKLSDISFLSSLTKLTKLDLTQNYIGNISYLEDLTNLKSLNLSANYISNIICMKKFLNLINLDLSYNWISNTDEAWAPLHQLPHYNPSWDSEGVRGSQSQ